MNAISVPIPDPATLPAELQDSKHWITWYAEKREEKIAKVPCDRFGFTDSMKVNHNSLETALDIAKRLRIKHGDRYGVGLAFMPEMGLVGVDLDSAIVGDRQAEHLQWMSGTFPTWGELSLSGLGVHLFYRGSFDGKRNAIVENARIEIFGTKGFIAITGNVLCAHPVAEWNSVFESIKEFIEKPAFVPAYSINGNGSLGGNTYGTAALAAQCERVRTAPNGQLHYTLCSAACSIGRLIPIYISWDDAELALYAATEQAGGKDMRAAQKTIRGQLEFGMTDPATRNDRFEYRNGSTHGVDLSQFMTRPVVEEIQEPAEPRIQDPGPFPNHLIKVPGFIGDVAEYTNSQSFVLQPELALAGAIALMSVLTGRKISDCTNLRTNLYILGIAKSGEGKDSARKVNKKILSLAGADDLIGPESWVSSAGLIKSLELQPASLCQNDEIGRELQATKDPKAAHLFSIPTVLIKFYTSSGETFFGGMYSGGNQVKIEQPHLVVYGTTVPGSFYSALGIEGIRSGFLGRCLKFEAPEQQQPIQKPIQTNPSDGIIQMVRKWFFWIPNQSNLSGAIPYPWVVPEDADAEPVFQNLTDYARTQRAHAGDPFDNLWARADENAKKLALLYACSERFGSDARITKEAAEWSCELTGYLIQKLCFTSSLFISRNQLESNSMDVEQIIKKSGKDGMTGQQLLRKTRNLTKQTRDEIIESLIQSGSIVRDTLSTPGRPKTVYRSNI